MNLQSTVRRAFKYWNDVNAIRRGRILPRLGWRVWGKATGRLGGKMFNR